MIIHGLQKMTLVDYQNASLVLNPGSEPVIEDEEIFSYLKKRKGMLDGVVVTGGEPTVHGDLLDFMKRIKDLGYSVKLDTNGYRPDVLKAAVEGGYADYVAMDIKNSLSSYPETAGVPHIFTSLIQESISYLLENHIPYEFRTTVVHELHSDEDFESIGKMCAGCSNYFLQSYSDRGDIINPIFSSPTAEEMERYIKILRKTIENVSFRDR